MAKDCMVVKARAALASLWDKVFIRGRCWGLKMDGRNPYYIISGTTIILANENEIVVVSEGEDKCLKIHEFRRIGSKNQTNLGQEVREILLASDLVIQD